MYRDFIDINGMIEILVVLNGHGKAHTSLERLFGANESRNF